MPLPRRWVLVELMFCAVLFANLSSGSACLPCLWAGEVDRATCARYSCQSGNGALRPGFHIGCWNTPAARHGRLAAHATWPFLRSRLDVPLMLCWVISAGPRCPACPACIFCLQVLAARGHAALLDLPPAVFKPELEPFIAAVFRHILEDPATLQVGQ